jgi:hypothetical protein
LVWAISILLGSAENGNAENEAELWLVWRRLAITNTKRKKAGISPRLKAGTAGSLFQAELAPRYLQVIVSDDFCTFVLLLLSITTCSVMRSVRFGAGPCEIIFIFVPMYCSCATPRVFVS